MTCRNGDVYDNENNIIKYVASETQHVTLGIRVNLKQYMHTSNNKV